MLRVVPGSGQHSDSRIGSDINEPEADFIAQSSILRASAQCSETLLTTKVINDISVSYIMKTIRKSFTNKTLLKKNSISPIIEEYWLWSAATAFNEINQGLLNSDEFRSFTPCGGVCFGLHKKDNDHYTIRTDLKGQIYCFLPTCMEFDFPFHINGCFAVQSDRRRLVEKFIDDRKKRRFQWNDLVLKAVCKALLLGLENALTLCGPHSFETLTKFWPTPIDSSSLKALETIFLSTLTDPSRNYKVLSDGDHIGCLQQSWFLNVSFPELMQNVILTELRSNLMHVLQNSG
ncbi:unnamed protein product [Didymodactylos carnosus]|uniref:Uncharacterized protein n=1 Tax=Didymodactylos carnosus TaxID=1234261 RepID=A0A816B6H3_9BILA|nr:unnamed protein product [Didymodactylos carnosus]CAF4483303.1 unnamed protein product [Didymodactylos carnosus]